MKLLTEVLSGTLHQPLLMNGAGVLTLSINHTDASFRLAALRKLDELHSSNATDADQQDADFDDFARDAVSERVEGRRC